MSNRYRSQHPRSKPYVFWTRLAGLTLIVVALLTTWMVASLAVTPA